MWEGKGKGGCRRGRGERGFGIERVIAINPPPKGPPEKTTPPKDPRKNTP